MKLLGFSQNEQFRKVLTVLVNHGIKTFPPLRNSKEFNSFALNSKPFSLDWIAWQIPVQVKKFDCFKPFLFVNFNTLLIPWTFSHYFYYSVYSLILSCISHLIMMTWSHWNLLIFLHPWFSFWSVLWNCLLSEMKLMMNFYRCSHNFSEVWNSNQSDAQISHRAQLSGY